MMWNHNGSGPVDRLGMEAAAGWSQITDRHTVLWFPYGGVWLVRWVCAME